MNDSSNLEEEEDDDWGDFDSNVEEEDYDPSTVDNNDGTAEQIITSKLAKKSSNYTIYSQNDIKTKINEIVEQVSCYLNLSIWSSTLLLRHFKWNKDRLFEQFFEFDTAKLLEKCGVLTDSLRKTPKKYKNGSCFECPMCLNDNINVSYSFEIGCSHIICNECWTDYIVTNIKSGKECINIKCPYYKCNVIISPEYIIKFIPQNMKDLQYRYQRFTLENYIEHNLFLSFCPAPNCHYIIEIDPGLIIDIKCFCGSFSCSKCKLLHCHRPCPCSIANKWVLKNSSDSENIQWIIAKTKKCPKCKVSIEKNHGCNHMVCIKCQYEFCWLCKTEWVNHGSATGGFYKCNIYEESKENGQIYIEEKKQMDAQYELERYSFYLQRYDNHIKSGQLALKQMKEINIINDEIQCVMDAFNVIIQCRKLLAWTYPIAYFLPSNYKKLPLFQDCQQELEKYTEHLHGLLEDKGKKKRKYKGIGELNNFMRVTQKFRDNMMNSIESEIANDLLEFMQ